ncbi:fungal-specific transcription factor domain-containing protein [Durotheca rogersii]|uniref:fungal-specific transcription factor domain-containing protein n=1 Tax=Durotheca rogersii TaxID=419775 RepID=UPI0022208483|nr:fungal-specific transcription factor domain-containing protein [Durotheca rogersii]KAI5867012.1 fungal-specific transcription factor domain-containing protein [Durotheca rogersii]
MDGSDLSDLQSQKSDRAAPLPPVKKKQRRGGDASIQKRRCVSTACIACRRRKSKCDGALPSCAACASVYGTECVYDPNSDHRRKGVYREKIDSMKARTSTLQILIEAILNAEEDDVPDIVRRIRTCDSLDAVAESILKQDFADEAAEDGDQVDGDYTTDMPVEGERDLARKMGELRVENGSTRFIGGTSHLIHWDIHGAPNPEFVPQSPSAADADPVTSWSGVTTSAEDVKHLLTMYFNWHYPYFTTLSRKLFYRDFLSGRSNIGPNKTAYCSPLLVNAMLALGCHFSDAPCAYATVGDSWTKGDHFFAEAKRLIVDNDEYEKPRLATVQALALMSVREAGCGREAKGWVYSGMSFRMAQDLGLNLDIGGIRSDNENLDEQEIDARRVTFWGCFLFDKCWSNYLGRLPQIPKNSYSVPKYDVFPDEDSEAWCPYTDAGFDESARQPSRTRTVGLQLSKLCEISSDLLLFFYHPNHIGRSSGKSVELKKLSELHRRLEDWRKELPKELEPKEGQLPNVILVHMFFHLQYIHLFRPFLKYSPTTSPLPLHVSPRRICTANAGAISKLMRLYKKLYNLRQICNIAVYMLHSACTIHILNLPEKTARRDIIHGVKHLEEIAEDWLCGRRTLSIISVLARKWNVELPDEASHVLRRTDEKWGTFKTSDVPSPRSHTTASSSPLTNITSTPPHTNTEQPSNAALATESTAPTAPSMAASASIVSSCIIDSVAPSPSDFQPDTQSLIDNVTIMSNTIPLDTDSGLTTPEWQQPQRTPTILNYPRSYASTPATRPNRSPHNVGRSRGSNPTTYAVDGQDWYLKDGVNWQSSFDAWNMGNGASGINVSDPSMFIFTSNAQPNNAGRPLPAPMDFNFESLGNLNTSVDGWDLPHLE